jgi:hypothetical protein
MRHVYGTCSFAAFGPCGDVTIRVAVTTRFEDAPALLRQRDCMVARTRNATHLDESLLAHVPEIS